MKLALPKFQYRFVPRMGNVIHPGNFHPVGTQAAADEMVDRVLEGGKPEAGSGGRWLLVGGSGGFGSAARVALGAGRGAHTLNVSLDAVPQPESSNKIRKLGSPAFHRNLAIERRLRALDLTATTVNADAFDPETRRATAAAIRDQLGGPIDGLVWALAAPRGLDPRTGKPVSSALRPVGRTVQIKTFTGADGDTGPEVVEFAIEPGSPEEAIRTQYVMGGRIVEQWIEDLLEAGVLAKGFKLLTISYRGTPLNEGVYRKGLIGLAKAELEFYTKALDAVLAKAVEGSAVCVEGPAVVTEASGGIPGVPLYLSVLMDVLGDRFEDPLASMVRLFSQHFGPDGPTLDEEGLLRMDDRELSEEVVSEMQRRFDGYGVGDAFPRELYESFMTAYARTRGFGVAGVDYDAEFDTDEVTT